jgi:uncharacterized protein
MPITPTYPGVYIEEVPSGVRTIVGVATSVTAFIGRALRGRTDEPTRIQSFAEFQRRFGGLWSQSMMSYAVQHYFLSGGADAIIVRVHNGAAPATLTLPAPAAEALTLEAASPGKWGNQLQAIVDHNTKDKDAAVPDPNLFNLTVQEVDAVTKEIRSREVFLNVSQESASVREVSRVLKEESQLVTVKGAVPTGRPNANPLLVSNSDGSDGSDIDDLQISDPGLEDPKKGLWALEKADLFNLMCIPPLTRTTGPKPDTTLAKAAAYCQKRRAMLIVDPPGWTDVASAESGVDTLRNALGSAYGINAGVWFPSVRMSDPLQENRLDQFAPCGLVAGVFARTDAQRGVWKAPAGLEASLPGVRELSYKLTDGENGRLNPLGINCHRSFPVYGNVIWGARTLAGADRLTSEWKYIPVRRTALFIEESLYRGTQWVVFEPNDEPLWAQIRLNVGAFMHGLFRQGAFQGATPRDAYLVKCDKETTTQDDINKGIVNIVVGFAPLKPAEFVIIKIQQMAGQIQA